MGPKSRDTVHLTCCNVVAMSLLVATLNNCPKPSSVCSYFHEEVAQCTVYCRKCWQIWLVRRRYLFSKNYIFLNYKYKNIKMLNFFVAIDLDLKRTLPWHLLWHCPFNIFISLHPLPLFSLTMTPLVTLSL